MLQKQQQNFASCSGNYDGDSYQRHLFLFTELNIWWHNYFHINNRIYKKVIFLKPVLLHDCVQITGYKVHVYSVDKKNQLDVTFVFFISLLLVAQHV